MDDGRPISSFPVQEKVNRPKRTIQLILKTVKRYWYVVIAVLVITAGVGYFVTSALRTENAWKRASDYYGRADYENAAKALDGVSVPSDTERLMVYSQTMLATRQLDDALVGYNKLYEAKKDPNTKIIIGNIYNEQKRYEEAEKVYKEAFAANPSYVQAYVNLATLYKLQGRAQDAIAVAKQGVQNNDRSATLYELLVSMLMDNKDSADFKAAVEKLKEINPQDPLLEAINL